MLLSLVQNCCKVLDFYRIVYHNKTRVKKKKKKPKKCIYYNNYNVKQANITVVKQKNTFLIFIINIFLN